jgi:RNA polymerase-binding transcription factor DksA
MGATTLGAARVSALRSTSSLAKVGAALESDRDARQTLTANHAKVVLQFAGVDNDAVLECELVEAAIAHAGEGTIVSMSLACMDAGAYRTCGPCGAQVPLESLQLFPSARLGVRLTSQESSVLG